MDVMHFPSVALAIRACIVSATVKLPHSEPVMLPHYIYTIYL